MSTLRVLYGVARVPKTLAPDDPRLPSVLLGPLPLRLNTVPLPPQAWGERADHAARMQAMLAWLQAACGEYDAAPRRFLQRYLAEVEATIARHAGELAAALAPFGGLYRVEDWAWSAPRPLPRAWWREGEAWLRADFAFWDGNSLLTFRAGDPPPVAQRFWDGAILPSSPFRRILPEGLDGAQLRPSSP